jgi:hypothetical protein
VNAQPRSHSASTQSAGSVPSHANAPLVDKKRAATKHAVATNSASASMSANDVATASASGAPPMSWIAM